MKRILLLMSMVCATGVFAQDYYAVRKTGTNYYFNWGNVSAGGTTLVMNRNADDVVSSTQTIPFNFKFYGIDVNKYKASDNGYITFETTTTTSYNAPTALPDAGGPNNAIYAFWSNTELKAAPNTQFPTKIYSYTLGTAPNRIHFINFFGLSQKGVAISGNSNVISTSILLYEGTEGKFQIINSGAFGGPAFIGTVGCENADGTQGTQLDGAPATSYTPSADGDNGTNVVYEFTYGTQPSVDVAGVFHNLQTVVNKTQNIVVSGQLANYGTTPVTSFTLNYSINGASPLIEQKTGLNIAPSGGTYNFTHGATIQSLVAGQVYDIKIWASDINGGSIDENESNDTLHGASIAINGTTAPKTVLIEEASGAWCGFCPDGHLVLKDILSRYDNAIGVVNHNGDGMVNPQSDIVNGTYVSSYPAAIIDRSFIQTYGSVPLVQREQWEPGLNERLSVTTPVQVSIIDKSYNESTRQISFTVKAKFVDYYGGDLRMNAMVVEDNVRGVNAPNTWTQHNYYSKEYNINGVGGTGHPLYNYPEWLVGYRHNHVVRNIPSGAWGTAGVINEWVNPDQEFTKTYTYTLGVMNNLNYSGSIVVDPLYTTEPGFGWNKPASIHLIGFVSLYNDDPLKRNVMNAVEIPLWDVANGISKTDKNVNQVSVYPNPAISNTSVSFELTRNSNVTVEILNTMGQKVMDVTSGTMPAGTQTATFSVEGLSAGIYFVKVNTGTSVSTQKFMVSK